MRKRLRKIKTDEGRQKQKDGEEAVEDVMVLEVAS